MRRLRRVRLGIGAGLVIAVCAPAHAAAWTCSASAARATIAGQTAEPATAGGAAAPCRAGSSELASPALPLGLTTGSLTAQTAAPAQATAAVADAALSLPAGLLPAPGGGLVDAVPPLSIDVPPAGPASVDIRPALRALLRPVPTVELLRVGSATASATGRCVAGDPVVSGTSALAGAVVAGQPVDLDGPRSDVVPLLAAYSLDPSDIDLAKVVQHGSSLTPAALRPLLQPLLDALPPVAVPATLADLDLRPGERLQDGGRRIYRALHVRASVAGTELADAVLGEASAGGDGCSAGAGGAGAGGVADLALQCASQKVVLIDVLDAGRRVRLVGAAAGRYVGRRVAIRLAATRAIVARPLVGPDGTFRATAPLPARRIRGTNAARYRASIDGERSLPLKLSRRMIVTGTTATKRATTIRGRLTGPLARGTSITVKRRLSCSRWTVVKRIAMPRGRRFRVTIPAVRGAASSVLRLQTTVAALDRSGRRKPTFTLPRYVVAS
jgi:hypothetical protein